MRLNVKNCIHIDASISRTSTTTIPPLSPILMAPPPYIIFNILHHTIYAALYLWHTMGYVNLQRFHWASRWCLMSLSLLWGLVVNTESPGGVTIDYPKWGWRVHEPSLQFMALQLHLAVPYQCIIPVRGVGGWHEGMSENRIFLAGRVALLSQIRSGVSLGLRHTQGFITSLDGYYIQPSSKHFKVPPWSVIIKIPLFNFTNCLIILSSLRFFVMDGLSLSEISH